MIFKCFLVLVLFEVFSVVESGKRQALMFGLRDNPLMRFPAAFGDPPGDGDAATAAGEGDKNGKRNRRCLPSVLALLWPQVVGPVEQGVINEKGYREVPKMLIEYRLDNIRKMARQEEETRLMIREYLKTLTEAQDRFYGYPTHSDDSSEKNNII